MVDVLLDGVTTALPGPPPASLAEVRMRLEEMLAERGRVLAGLWCDGQPFDEATAAQPLSPGARIDVRSMTFAEAVTQVSAALAPDFVALQRQADELAHLVVRVPWPEVQPRCIELLENTGQTMQRAVDVAALAGENSAAGEAVAALAGAVETWMNGVQQADAAAVCLALDGDVVPALGRVAAVLQGAEAT